MLRAKVAEVENGAKEKTMRFSKTKLREWLIDQIGRVERTWRFDPRNGTAQLTHRHDDAKIAYGEYTAYRHLLDEIEGGYV